MFDMSTSATWPCYQYGFLPQGNCSRSQPYTGLKQFYEIRDQQCKKKEETHPWEFNEYVVFTDMDETTFRRDFYDNTDVSDIHRHAWASYDKAQKMLLTRLPDNPGHEAARVAFGRHLLKALEPMDLHRKIVYEGTAIHEGSAGIKRPDAQFRPINDAEGRLRDTPTVVLEVMVTRSEVSPKLTSDMSYWFGQSGSDIQVLFMMRINRCAPEIVLQRWEWRPTSVAGTKRVSNTFIRRMARGRYEVLGDQCTLDLEKLLLSKPHPIGVKDVHLEITFLSKVAQETWLAQEFLEEDEAGQDPEVEDKTRRRKTPRVYGINPVLQCI